jgi:hypothetical protein
VASTHQPQRVGEEFRAAEIAGLPRRQHVAAAHPDSTQSRDPGDDFASARKPEIYWPAPSGRPYRIQELVDLELEAVAVARQRLRRRQHLRRGLPGLSGATLYIDDVRGDLLVPCAACCTLREISCVAAPCCSTAAAMAEEISDSFSMVPLISLIAFTESWVAAWIPLICWPISPVAFAVCSANALTSDATTAKPRPASPARVASMVALSAKRLVCPAMLLLTPALLQEIQGSKRKG